MAAARSPCSWGEPPAKSGQVVVGKRLGPDKPGGTQPGRGGTRGAAEVLECCRLLQSCSANKEKSEAKRMVEKQLQDNLLDCTSLKLPGNCLESLKNVAAVLRDWAACLK